MSELKTKLRRMSPSEFRRVEKETRELLAAIDAEKIERRNLALAGLRKRFEGMASSIGMSLDEVLAPRRGRPSKWLAGATRGGQRPKPSRR